MEQEKRRRGRPKIFTGPLDEYAPSRRQAMNAMYMYEGVEFISVAATEIPDSHLIWVKDDVARTSSGRQGIVEQIGRMVVQDRFGRDDCIYVATLAAAAVKAGYSTREVEKAIRKIRMTNKALNKNPKNKLLEHDAVHAADILAAMGVEDNEHT